MRMPAYPTSENPWAAADGKPDSAAPLAPQHDIDVQALAQQAALQRPQFAVDEATEGEGEEWVGGEGGEGGEGDEGLLGQVDAMLQAEPAGAGTYPKLLSLAAGRRGLTHHQQRWRGTCCRPSRTRTSSTSTNRA